MFVQHHYVLSGGSLHSTWRQLDCMKLAHVQHMCDVTDDLVTHV